MNEAKTDTPPIPYFPSRRLMGVELECSAGSNRVYHKPACPNGWVAKRDGTLHHGGEEFILEPPVPMVEALPLIEAFSKAAIEAKTYMAKLGGYHIHVQIHDLDQDAMTRLCQLYWRYQDQIDMLCGPSRRSKPTPNAFCWPFDSDHKPTKDEIIEMFQLSFPASNRADAKGSRQKRVVNLAMARCINPLHRSVEFRQPSPSKHVANIYGWMCFACGLVEISKHDKLCKVYIDNRRPGWRSFTALCRRIERVVGARDLAAWVKWRRDYLAASPSQEQLNKLYSGLVSRAHGLFYISRRLGMNLAVTRATVEAEVRKGHLLEEAPGKYRVRYEAVAPIDLKTIIRNWTAREQPAQAAAPAPTPTAAPATPVLQPTQSSEPVAA